MAYIVQFDVPEEQVEEALAKNLHIISLDSAAVGRDQALSQPFRYIQTQLDTKAGVVLRDSRPDLFEDIETELVQRAAESPEQASVIETASRLCFVMMPFGNRFDDVYRLGIAPAASENGLIALRADEMAGSGFILEQILSAIQQSRICVADLTGNNPNVLYEVGYAQAIRKPIVLLAGEGAQLPFDIAHQRVIMYGDDVESTRERLSGAVAVALSDERLEEAARLFELGQYRATIAAASVVLEHKLRQLLAKRIPGDFESYGAGSTIEGRPCVGGVLTESLRKALTEVVSLRNRAVHSLDQPTRKDAQFVLTNVRRVLDDVNQTGKPR